MEKFYIKVIVEGNEEETFFDIVKTIGTHDKFVLEIENAHGYGGIADAFLSALREGELYDCVICAYDVDNRAAERKSPFNLVRKQLTLLFGDESITDAVSFCTNPNILQYFLLAADSLDKVSLVSTSKMVNTIYVHRYWAKIASDKTDKTGRKIKSPYGASQWQLDIMKFSIINSEYQYENLLRNASALPLDYKNNLPAGNLLPMLIALKDGDEAFFKRIHELIEDTEY